MCLLIIVCIFQCVPSEPDALEISEQSLIFLPSGDVKSFNVESNTKWEVKSNESWLTFSPTSSSKNDAVTVTATTNTSFFSIPARH